MCLIVISPFWGLFFASRVFLADMTQQLLIMEMFLITLISRVVYRRRSCELEPPECMAEESEANKQTPKIILNGAVNEDGLPRF